MCVDKFISGYAYVSILHASTSSCPYKLLMEGTSQPSRLEQGPKSLCVGSKLFLTLREAEGCLASLASRRCTSSRRLLCCKQLQWSIEAEAGLAALPCAAACATKCRSCQPAMKGDLVPSPPPPSPFPVLLFNPAVSQGCFLLASSGRSKTDCRLNCRNSSLLDAVGCFGRYLEAGCKLFVHLEDLLCLLIRRVTEPSRAHCERLPVAPEHCGAVLPVQSFCFLCAGVFLFWPTRALQPPTPKTGN